MDADGDVTVTWNGNGAQWDQTASSIYNADTNGVFMRKFSSPAPTSIPPADFLDVLLRRHRGPRELHDRRQPGVPHHRHAAQRQLRRRLERQRRGRCQRHLRPPLHRTDRHRRSDGRRLRAANGTPINSSGQISQPMQAIIVNFDEDMATTGSGSVLDPNNYRLLKDGVVQSGYISKIYYGLNDSSTG